jgi:hypothetical protein
MLLPISFEHITGGLSGPLVDHLANVIGIKPMNRCFGGCGVSSYKL